MAKQLPKRDLENVGLGVTGACVALVTLVVAALIFMVAQKGLSAFVKDGVSVVEFFTGTKWDLANTAENGLPYTGALPLIITSFAVMVLSTLIALPIAIGSAIFAVEISPKFGSKVFQPLIELLTGIPSVVFGLIGFHVVVGLMKSVFHVSTGLGILPGAIVLAVMILPTMTTLSVDGLRAVPDSYRQGSLALGYTRWQTIWHVVLKSAMPSLMTAVILGMTRAEVDSKIDQIIEFSECGDFIDTPVKRYSSGMFVKLAFAVAAHLDSEIMVMDEVLAVGDMKFQQKCLGKMSDVAGQEGRTVLYVSHNMSTIRQLCTRCVVLDQGRVIFDGDVEQAIAVYMETTDVNVVHYDLMDVSRMNASAGKRMRLETLDFVGKESSVFADTEKIRVRITWRVSEPFAGVHLKLNLHFRDSTPVGITHPVNLGAAVPGKLYTTEFEFDPSLLGEGQYFFYVDVFDGVLTQAVCLDKPVTEFAFEVTSGDLTMPEWAPGWGRIHFPPVKVLENGYDG